jgi:beta-galactosidase
LSHYPQHPAFLDACDALGVLVYAEIASWKSVRPGPWARAAYRQLRNMIQRDRNHPSIVLWGFGNESRSRLAFRKMGRIVQDLDPTRATIYAENHLHRGSRWRTLKQTDVLGVNYELDRLDDAHALSRNGSVLISEVSNCAYTTRGDEEAELKQIAAFERDAALLRDRPFVAGYALWCYADYASQRRGRCRRQPGLVDAWRTPKMSASYMQAGLAKELFLHAYGDWGLNTEGSTRNIHLFSNAERLVVRVKEKVLADLEAKQYTLVTVPFYPEELQIVARVGDQERLVSLVPYGAAVGLVIEPDRQVCNAANRDTIGVRIRVVDAAGGTVSDHQSEVCLSAVGPGRIRFFSQRDSVEMHAGVGRFFVTGSGASGPVTLRATQNTLSAGVAVVEYTDG